MRKATLVLAFGFAASGCGTKMPAATFKIEASQLPKGAELVIYGEVVATREGSTIEFSMAEGKSVVAGTRAIRIATACGSVERPFELLQSMRTEPMSAEDELEERSDKGPVEATLVVGEMPRTQTVWVDAAEGVIKVGTQSLGPGEHSLFLEGCDDTAQRTVTVGGKDVGPLPTFDLTKHHPSLLITADKQACYHWQPVVYSEGGFMPNLHETRRLTDAHIHEVQFIDFFMLPPAETVWGKAGAQETRYRLNKVSCDTAVPAEPTAGYGKP